MVEAALAGKVSGDADTSPELPPGVVAIRLGAVIGVAKEPPLTRGDSLSILENVSVVPRFGVAAFFRFFDAVVGRFDFVDRRGTPTRGLDDDEPRLPPAPLAMLIARRVSMKDESRWARATCARK